MLIQKRSIGMAILFTFITCGIYGIYWMYKIFEESRIISRDHEGSAGIDLLLTIVTCGLYGFFAIYKASSRLYEAGVARGNTYANDDSILLTILYVFASIISIAIIQSKINKFLN